MKADQEHAVGKPHSLSVEFDVADTEAIRDLYLSYQMAKKLKVQLNDTLILDVTLERPSPSPVTLLLKPVTRELLTSGKNTLSVTVTPGGQGFEAALRRSVE